MTSAEYYTKYKKSDKSVYLISVLNLATELICRGLGSAIACNRRNHKWERKLEQLFLLRNEKTSELEQQ